MSASTHWSRDKTKEHVQELVPIPGRHETICAACLKVLSHVIFERMCASRVLSLRRGFSPSMKSLIANKQPGTYFFRTFNLGVHSLKIQLRECIIITARRSRDCCHRDSRVRRQ